MIANPTSAVLMFLKGYEDFFADFFGSSNKDALNITYPAFREEGKSRCSDDLPH